MIFIVCCFRCVCLVLILRVHVLFCSGAMSGGGKPRKGGMSSSVVSGGAGFAAVSDEEVKLAEVSVKDAFDAHAEAKQRREGMAMDVRSSCVSWLGVIRACSIRIQSVVLSIPCFSPFGMSRKRAHKGLEAWRREHLARVWRGMQASQSGTRAAS